MESFYTIQIKWIEALHQIRGPFVDGFFQFFNFFDRPEFFLILIPATWMGYHWKEGLRLFYILALSALINYSLKQLFETPRPFHLYPSLGVIEVSGYGFPSGGAQTALLLAGIIWNRFKNAWGFVIALNFFFWVSLSRVYLGVHFPTDVLGGWAVGAVLLSLFIYGFPRIERSFNSLKRIQLLGISQVVPLLLICICQDCFLARLFFMAMGIGLGVFICSYYSLFLQPSKRGKEGILRACLGIFGLFAIYQLLLAVSIRDARYFNPLFSLLGLWLSLAAPLSWRFLQKGAKL